MGAPLKVQNFNIVCWMYMVYGSQKKSISRKDLSYDYREKVISRNTTETIGWSSLRDQTLAIKSRKYESKQNFSFSSIPKEGQNKCM